MAKVGQLAWVASVLIVFALVGLMNGGGAGHGNVVPGTGTASPSFHAAVGPTLFPVTFQESGLVSGTEWQVGTAPLGSDYFTYTNSTHSTLEQQLANGTYQIVASTPSNFSEGLNTPFFTVAGKSLDLSIPFTAGDPVTFLQSGLPGGSVWYVLLQNRSGAVNLSSVQGSLVAFEPSGSYNFSTYASGYTSSPVNGTFTLPSSGPLVVNLTFAPTPVGYLDGILTVETAQLWIDGVPHGYTAGGGFSFGMAPGVHTIIVSALGYQTYSGYAVIKSGQTTDVYIELKSDSTTLPPPSPRAFTSTDEALMVALGAASVVLAASTALLWLRGRSRSQPPIRPSNS